MSEFLGLHIQMTCAKAIEVFFLLLLYFSIVSFGAPAPNEYRLVVEGQVPISLQTAMVGYLHGCITRELAYIVPPAAPSTIIM